MLQGCANQDIPAGRPLWKPGAARCSKIIPNLLSIKDLFAGDEVGGERKLSNQLRVCVPSKSDFHNYFHNFLGGFLARPVLVGPSQESQIYLSPWPPVKGQISRF